MRFSIGSRDFKAPAPYVGVYEPIHQPKVNKLSSGSLTFLYPSGSSIPADRWYGRIFEPPENELTAVSVVNWQYFDEYKGSFRIPKREEGQINVSMSSPVPGDTGQPDGKGGFRQFSRAYIFDHERGIHAILDFGNRYKSEVYKIWSMFLDFEKSWRVN